MVPYLDYKTDKEQTLSNVSDVFICMKNCDMNDQCNGFSYDTTNNNCTLKNKLETPFLNQNSNFYFKNYLSVNDKSSQIYQTYYSTNYDPALKYAVKNMDSKMVDNDNITPCLDSCNSNIECTGFTYDKLNKKCLFKAVHNNNILFKDQDYDYYAKSINGNYALSEPIVK